MAAKLQETEEALNAALVKAQSAEKSKKPDQQRARGCSHWFGEGSLKCSHSSPNKWAINLISYLFFPRQAQTNNATLEKKQKKIDQEINEWKSRLDDVQIELDNAQKEARNYSTEVSLV